MNNLNSVLLEGVLTQDAEHRTTAKGTKVCTFTIESNKYYMADSEKKATGYFEVEAWRKLAETCETKAKKGRCVRIVGWLKQYSYKDRFAVEREKTVICADHIEFRPITEGEIEL